ncbi:MAG TPA: M42 family metallopeptidase [Candidatus Cloacimonadota bacterium]|nr:M42 family metallopeptidase [Candidatus Cloacimonadota bacterium]
MDRIELLKKLTLTPGISGHEHRVANFMQEELGGIADFSKDNMGSCTFRLKGSSAKPKIMFVAHMDEIGFIVSDIMSNGFIKMLNIGGWNANTLLSSPVEIINAKGEKYPGIIGSIPVHFLKNREDVKPELESMFVDIGADSQEEVENDFGIQLGDEIVPIPHFQYIGKKRKMMSKAFDDRAGVAAVIEIGKITAQMPHPNTVYCVGSVQEEVGTRGAQTLANYSDADICFVLEGAPADDIPGIPATSQTGVGKGAHVRVFDPTMIVNPKLKNFIIDVANENNIKIQLAVRKGGGTDGRQMHTAGHGIPTIVLGTPVRYAHSHNCLISMNDFDELIKLLTAIVQNLDEQKLKEILG